MHTPVLAASLTLLAALALGGCGSSDSAPSTTPATTPPVSQTAPVDDTAPPAGSPTADPGTAATSAFDACTDVTADEMGAALSETVTEKTETVGCGYEPGDDKQPVVSLEQKGLDGYAGGFGSATGSLQYLVTDGTEADVDAGSGAHIVVGDALGGGSVQGIGMVLVGDQVVQVNLRQDAGLTVDDVTTLLTAAVKLVGSKG